MERERGTASMEREKTCCFTGHRPNKLPWGSDETDRRCVELKEAIRREVEAAYDRGFRHFICGMAQGCDFYFCEAALALREERPGVTVEAAVPCEEQAEKWRPEDRERWERLVGLCDYETVVQRHYDRGCMLRRDRYMVDRSSLLIAAFDGTAGGTQYTLLYALRRGVETVTLEPC